MKTVEKFSGLNLKRNTNTSRIHHENLLIYSRIYLLQYGMIIDRVGNCIMLISEGYIHFLIMHHVRSI